MFIIRAGFIRYSAVSALEVIRCNWCLVMSNEFKIKKISNYICKIEVSDRFRQGSLFRDVFFLFLSSYFSVDDGNNKNIMKMKPQGALLLFIYEVSIVVLIDFIAILLTRGIFLIQIVNTNITKVYLNHFHSKNNFQKRFPKSWVFKVSTNLNHSLSIATRWNKLRWRQQRHHNNLSPSEFKKYIYTILYNYS